MNEDTINRFISAKMQTRIARSLEKMAEAACRSDLARKSAALRLARLRAATKAAPATGLRLTTSTTRTKPATAAKPATAPAPTEKAKFEAVQSFMALSRHRTALHRKRRTPAETELYFSMTALMPAGVPQGNDPTEWRNFIARIEGLLAEIKGVKTL